MTYPYSDTRMRYDMSAHRYVLKEEHVLEKMNIDLRDVLNTSASADVGEAVKVFLGRISSEVYGFIYRTVAHRYSTERMLAKDAEAREMLLRAMEEQLLYVLQNGDLGAFSGVNVSSGTVVDRASMRKAEIAPLAEDALFEIGFVNSIIPRDRMDISPNYAEEGY